MKRLKKVVYISGKIKMMIIFNVVFKMSLYIIINYIGMEVICVIMFLLMI